MQVSRESHAPKFLGEDLNDKESSRAQSRTRFAADRANMALEQMEKALDGKLSDDEDDGIGGAIKEKAQLQQEDRMMKRWGKVIEEGSYKPGPILRMLAFVAVILFLPL